MRRRKNTYILLFLICVIFFSLYYVYKVESFIDIDVGFIVTRCVRDERHNHLYKECYDAIRKFHPDLKIVIIDDNSNKQILKEHNMKNVEIIQSDYPARGEYLPYWYLLHRKMFKKAIIIQDSMILNTRVEYEKVNDYKFLYEFTSDRVNSDEVNILIDNSKKPKKLHALYNSNNWVGCFGATMVITSEFLEKVEDTIGITRWVPLIDSRSMRMGLERCIALACIYTKGSNTDHSLFGSLYDTQIINDPELSTKHTIEIYLADKTRIKDSIIKIWNGR